MSLCVSAEARTYSILQDGGQKAPWMKMLSSAVNEQWQFYVNGLYWYNEPADLFQEKHKFCSANLKPVWGLVHLPSTFLMVKSILGWKQAGKTKNVVLHLCWRPEFCLFFLEKPMQKPVLVLTMKYRSNGMDGLFQGWADLRPGKQQFCYSVYLKHQFIFLEARGEGMCEMFVNLRCL